jgi:hypothetical protein
VPATADYEREGMFSNEAQGCGYICGCFWLNHCFLRNALDVFGNLEGYVSISNFLNPDLSKQSTSLFYEHGKKQISRL